MKRVLDMCCGGRMFWFDKANPDAVFIDARQMERQVIWTGKGGETRSHEVQPDFVMDFRDLKFADESFSLVVFDPPHLAKRNGKTGWMNKKYGSLDPVTWRDDLRKGFTEGFRVLKPDGTLIFKWSSIEIPLSAVLELCAEKPLFGHRSGKNNCTHWVAFMKRHRT